MVCTSTGTENAELLTQLNTGFGRGKTKKNLAVMHREFLEVVETTTLWFTYLEATCFNITTHREALTCLLIKAGDTNYYVVGE